MDTWWAENEGVYDLAHQQDVCCPNPLFNKDRNTSLNYNHAPNYHVLAKPNSCSNCAMSPPKRSCSDHLGPQKWPWSHELFNNPIPTWLPKFRNLGCRERGSTQTHVLHHPLDHLRRQWWPPDTAGHIVDSKRIGICWSCPSPDSWRVKRNQEMNH